MEDTEIGFEFMFQGRRYDVTIRVHEDHLSLVDRDGLHPSMDEIVLASAQICLMDQLSSVLNISDTVH